MKLETISDDAESILRISRWNDPKFLKVLACRRAAKRKFYIKLTIFLILILILIYSGFSLFNL